MRLAENGHPPSTRSTTAGCGHPGAPATSPCRRGCMPTSSPPNTTPGCRASCGGAPRPRLRNRAPVRELPRAGGVGDGGRLAFVPSRGPSRRRPRRPSHPLPFRSGSVDTVISSDVLEHLPDPGWPWPRSRGCSRPAATCCSTPPSCTASRGSARLPAPHPLLVGEAGHRAGSRGRRADRGRRCRRGAGRPHGQGARAGAARRPVAAAVSNALVGGFGRTPPGRLVRRATCATFPLAHFLVARRP